jgi:hypothetical protein
MGSDVRSAPVTPSPAYVDVNKPDVGVGVPGLKVLVDEEAIKSDTDGASDGPSTLTSPF